MRIRNLFRPVAVFAVLSGGLAAGSMVLTPGTANATPCGTAIAAGSTCTLTGTVTITAGSLTLLTPSSLTWADMLNGLNQTAFDAVPGDEQYTVNDATGSGAGWHVTTSATTFTNGTHTFPNATTLVTTGSITSISATTGPTVTCTGVCILPTDTTSYPVAIATLASAPVPVVIYDTAVVSGLGQMVVGGSSQPNPVGWWVNIPASASAGAYTSTLTMAIISAP